MPIAGIGEQKGIRRGAIPSSKLGRMVRWKNTLARECIRLFDYDPQVLFYEEFPCIVSYRWKEKLYRYVPDFLVRYQNKNIAIIACTWTRHLQDPAYLARWTAGYHWCQKRHYTFSLVTEATLQQHAVLIRNLQQLAVHAHRTIEAQVVEYLFRTILSAPHPLSLPEILLQTPQVPARVVPGTIWHLLAVGRLKADLTQPLHPATTRLWWKGAPDVAQ